MNRDDGNDINDCHHHNEQQTVGIFTNPLDLLSWLGDDMTPASYEIAKWYQSIQGMAIIWFQKSVWENLLIPPEIDW